MTRQSLLIDTQLYIRDYRRRTGTGDDIDRVILILLLLLLVNVYIMIIIVVVAFTFEWGTWGVIVHRRKRKQTNSDSRVPYREVGKYIIL